MASNDKKNLKVRQDSTQMNGNNGCGGGTTGQNNTNGLLLELVDDNFNKKSEKKMLVYDDDNQDANAINVKDNLYLKYLLENDNKGFVSYQQQQQTRPNLSSETPISSNNTNRIIEEKNEKMITSSNNKLNYIHTSPNFLYDLTDQPIEYNRNRKSLLENIRAQSTDSSQKYHMESDDEFINEVL